MKKSTSFTPMQNLVWNTISIGSVIGIFGFLATQTDVKDPFVIGVYFVVCAVVVWGARRFVADNVDEKGRYKPKVKPPKNEHH
jgi:hypothetical protein